MTTETKSLIIPIVKEIIPLVKASIIIDLKQASSQVYH